jgi:hypothetical protein
MREHDRRLQSIREVAYPRIWLEATEGIRFLMSLRPHPSVFPPAQNVAMRLKLSAAAANEQLLVLVTEGLRLHRKLWSDYDKKKSEPAFNEDALRQRHLEEIDAWTGQVANALRGIFPMGRQEILFHHPDVAMRGVAEPHYDGKCTTLRLLDLIKGLDKIRQTAIPEYTDLPIKDRLSINDIDSFAKARDSNHAMYSHLLNIEITDFIFRRGP